MRSIWAVAAVLWIPHGAVAFTVTVGGGVQIASNGFQLGQMSPFASDAGVATEDFATPAGCGASKLVATGTKTIGSRSMLNRRLAPENDASCYFALGASALNASASLAFPVPAGKHIDYIGFYWGSIDAYNYLGFANGAGFAIPLGTYGAEIDGRELVVAPGGAALHGSSFVGFTFSIGEVVRSMTLRQTNFAFELDNVSYRLVDVFPGSNIVEAQVAPERVDAPPSLALAALGIALVGLSCGRAHSARAAPFRSRQARLRAESDGVPLAS